MVIIYVLTAVKWTHSFCGLRAYATEAEADAAKDEYAEWRAGCIAAFSQVDMLFVSRSDLRDVRTEWFVKLPWGMGAHAGALCTVPTTPVSQRPAPKGSSTRSIHG